MADDKPQSAESKMPVPRQVSHDGNPLIQYGPDLPQHLQDQLKVQYLKGQIEIAQKAQELHMDNQALAGRLSDMSTQVKQASDNGASATITGAYNDRMGRTEVIIGNTETAAKGKLDRSQKGQSDYTLFYVIIGVIGVLVLASILIGR